MIEKFFAQIKRFPLYVAAMEYVKVEVEHKQQELPPQRIYGDKEITFIIKKKYENEFGEVFWPGTKVYFNSNGRLARFGEEVDHRKVFLSSLSFNPTISLKPDPLKMRYFTNWRKAYDYLKKEMSRKDF